ncbi:MinD/ParA family protein [Nonomuraea sp. NPDC005650]|uniref:MinD/ParA family ATP-binding protein n=1 Tax=Nonomuraea sp. NPDC005650 TaxID=3157045 RepID=UPI0033B4F8ED
MHGERDERPLLNTDDEVTMEVNGEDPDRTRTMRFPPPKLRKDVDQPPPPAPEPPLWWQADSKDDPAPRLGHFGTTAPPGEPRKGPPAVGPPPGPIELGALNAFQPPNPPAWDPPAAGTPDVPVFPQPGPAAFPPPQATGPSALATPGQADPHGFAVAEEADPAGFSPTEPSAAGTSSESLRPDRLLRTRRRPPAGGWRKAVFTLSGGLIRPKDSKAERHRQELIERIRQPVSSGHFRVAVMSLKGGVGKTTTTIGLGSTLAHHRGDRVIAVDANPDRGTLSEKLRMESPATVRDLLNDRAGIWRYADVRSYTSQAPSRLEVLASDRDPAISEAFNADDYRAVAQILEQFYSIAITDCGTGMLHSAMSAILDMSDQIVLVSPVTVDGARSASATLDWLQAHGHQDLAGSAVVVLSAVKNPRRNAVNVAELQEHFTKRCRAVIGVPFDPHLEQGSEVDLDLLRTATRDTYLEVGASIADRFGLGAPL